LYQMQRWKYDIVPTFKNSLSKGRQISK
jgi:hypothetical protein